MGESMAAEDKHPLTRAAIEEFVAWFQTGHAADEVDCEVLHATAPIQNISMRSKCHFFSKDVQFLNAKCILCDEDTTHKTLANPYAKMRFISLCAACRSS